MLRKPISSSAMLTRCGLPVIVALGRSRPPTLAVHVPSKSWARYQTSGCCVKRAVRAATTPGAATLRHCDALRPAARRERLINPQHVRGDHKQTLRRSEGRAAASAYARHGHVRRRAAADPKHLHESALDPKHIRRNLRPAECLPGGRRRGRRSLNVRRDAAAGRRRRLLAPDVQSRMLQRVRDGGRAGHSDRRYGQRLLHLDFHRARRTTRRRSTCTCAQSSTCSATPLAPSATSGTNTPSTILGGRRPKICPIAGAATCRTRSTLDQCAVQDGGWIHVHLLPSEPDSLTKLEDAGYSVAWRFVRLQVLESPPTQTSSTSWSFTANTSSRRRRRRRTSTRSSWRRRSRRSASPSPSSPTFGTSTRRGRQTTTARR